MATNDLEMYIKGGYKEYEFMVLLRTNGSARYVQQLTAAFLISAVSVNYPPLHEGVAAATIAFMIRKMISFDDQHIDPNADYSKELDLSC